MNHPTSETDSGTSSANFQTPNLLGQREPEVYGHLILAQIDQRLRTYAKERNVEIRSV
jgi:3-dehydroquinate dehydratase